MTRWPETPNIARLLLGFAGAVTGYVQLAYVHYRRTRSEG